MVHRVETVPLMVPGPGTERFLTVHRFGNPEARPKLYFHAALHADELPGTLILNRMLGWLRDADAANQIEGDIVVVPYANPVGLSNRIMGYHLGRYDLDGDGNFNRWYPDLSGTVGDKVVDRLGDDEVENAHLIHWAYRVAIEEWEAPGEANTLRKALMLLSADCDFVFDLHCHGEAIQYIYFPENHWAQYGDLAAELKCETVLLFPTDSGTNFDIAPTTVWHRLRKRFPYWPIAEPPFTTTLELRGQNDVGDDLALEDAMGLWRFLQRHGIVAGDPGDPPVLPCEPTPLSGSDNLVAPCAGVLSYHLDVGDHVEAGAVVADIVDPAEPDFETARTPVRSRATGVLYGRSMSRLVRPGQSFAVVSGHDELPPNDLPVIDY
ncbi:MAG: succinylglutamate desuccinylase/aspartoacylase family protein [Rhodospirillales bacterium]|nr:succinylglutamate desuccinylase/aspartoacylase family protein [Rhodospirillales bacterium]